MEKLLDLVQKLRESIVPTAEIKSISKKELLSFIEDADILKKMSIFHEKKQSKALKSIVHEAEEESVVPDLTTIRKVNCANCCVRSIVTLASVRE